MGTKEEVKQQIGMVLALIETKAKQSRFNEKADGKTLDSAAREIGAAADVLKSLAYHLRCEVVR
jgi:hypothetical protein